MKLDTSDMVKGLAAMQTKFDVALLVFGRQAATKLQSYAKKSARWVDRTGSARTRLQGSATLHSKGVRIILAHGVSYGIWLELAHEKRYAILEESLVRCGSKEIMPAFEQLMTKMGGRNA